MALTRFQREVCRFLGERRIASGESYIAGGSALNEITGGGRISRDLDLFHDTRTALAATWTADRDALRRGGFEIEIVQERPAFVEALVRGDADSVLLQWAHDSAFRFFPLVAHPELGATLHPFDLATNKVLALVGRVEARDWIDIMECDANIQPLGYLAWAACGKDPGLSPTSILDHAARTTHYSQIEIAALDFEGEPPNASIVARRWRVQLSEAAAIVGLLPAEHVGECILGEQGLFQGDAEALESALEYETLRFHRGSIRGAFPLIVG